MATNEADATGATEEQVDVVVQEDNYEEPTPADDGDAGQDEGAGMPSDPAGMEGEIPEHSESQTYNMNATGCMIGLIVASCVELAQAAKICNDMNTCTKQYGYAVSVGCISLILNLACLVLYRFKPGTIDAYIGYYSIFMTLWWGVGTIVLTFDAPFTTTGNGYFACWGAALISLRFAQISVAKFKAILGNVLSKALAGNEERRTLMLIMLLSTVLAFACLVEWDEVNTVSINDDGTVTADKRSSQELWGFLCGLISAIVIAVYQALKICTGCLTNKPMVLKGISWALIPWWLMGAGVLTFDQPFTETGNGYFMAWGAFLASVYLAYLTTVKGISPETPAS